jgi:pimeloyl-ACP methyl ester carboxylesterase
VRPAGIVAGSSRIADADCGGDARSDHPGGDADDRLHGGWRVGVCGVLRVPEDRSNPTGREIDLRVAVIPAIAAMPKGDPLFPLDGGPGQAATEDLSWTASVFSGIHSDRDIVLVDQRGTGGSNRLTAPDPPDLSGLSEADAAATMDAWLKQVLAEMPGDPRFYTTSVAMDDVDDVRAALGYGSIDLYGPSYGATAAQYYLRQHEEHVRAVVLDAGTLLDVPILERIAPNSQRALDILFERCAADTACRGAFPDLRSEFAAVMKRLSGHPVMTSVSHPWTGDPIVIDTMAFAAAVHGALVDVRFLGELPGLIHAAHQGSWHVVAEAIAAAAGPKTADRSQLVMSIVIRCSEGWARFNPAETARMGTGSYLRGVEVAIAKDQATGCRYAPPGIVSADDAKGMTSDVPMLLILGEADPQNPPANVADAPSQFPNSRTVVVPGQAHTVGHLGCMPSIVESLSRLERSPGSMPPARQQVCRSLRSVRRRERPDPLLSPGPRRVPAGRCAHDADARRLPPDVSRVVRLRWDVRISTMLGFRKERNMRRDPRVTVLCYDPRQPLRFLEVRGTVVDMTEDRAAPHLDKLASKYAGRPVRYFGGCVPARFAGTEIPVLCRVRPTHVVAVDATAGEVAR